MATQLKNVTQQGKELWGRLPASKRAVLAGVLLLTIAGVAFFATQASTGGQAVLFSGLSPEDAGQIVRQLDAEKVPYELDHNGTTIMVPENQVHKLRLSLAANGIPNGGGVGFEVFEKQAFGTTSFVEKMNYRRALQGELQRTIGSLSVIESARVHIAMRERSLYKNDDDAPSASVVLKMKQGRVLSKSQARGIVHLVSSSVEGLEAGRVTIVDDSGNVLASGDKDDSGGASQAELERNLEKRVTTMIERVVGPGHVAVTVTADLDTAQTERTEELYDPLKTSLRSDQRTVEGEGVADSASGVAGARGNLPGSAPGAAPAAAPGAAAAPAAGAAAASGKGTSRLSETHNYEVSRTVNRTIGPKASIKRLYVAVLVDGVPKAPPPGTAAKSTDEADDSDGEDGKKKEKVELVPRSKEELARIESLAREAAGIDPQRGDRIEVHSVPFVAGTLDSEEAPRTIDTLRAWLPTPHTALMAALGLGFLILGMRTLSAMRSGRGQGLRAEIVQSLPARVTDLEAGLPGSPAQASGMSRFAAGLPERPARDRAVDSIRTDAAHAARVLSQWINDPDAPGGQR